MTSEMTDLQQFWQRLWVAQKYPFSECIRITIPPRVSRFQALCRLPCAFRNGPVLIREEYLQAVDAIQDHQDKSNAVVVVGHPGIGTIPPVSD
jgi:hypothetical protein